MQIVTIKTGKVLPGSESIFDILDRFVTDLHDGEIVVITSKIVALCEGRVVAASEGNKKALVSQESELYFPRPIKNHTYYLSVTHNTLLLTAGIDNSNGSGNLVLLPKNPQQSANEIRQYLADKFGLRRVGIILTDSTSQPLRRGTIGVALVHSGFLAIRDYRGKPDVFGEPLQTSRSNVAGGVAAAAVTIMGEGAEQTPIAVVSDIPFIEFQNRNPSDRELQDLYVKPAEDLFGPLLENIPWKRGEHT